MVPSCKRHQVVWSKPVLGIREDYMGQSIWIKGTDKIEQGSGVTEYQQSNIKKEVEWSINGVMETWQCRNILDET